MLKKSIKITTLLTLGLFGALTSAVAQLPSTGVTLESDVLDGVYVQEHIPTKRVISYTYLREADVMWSKRVWRTIDLREKMNHPLFYPEEPLSDRMALWDVMKYGVLQEGSLTIYEPLEFDDRFRFPVKPPNGNVNDDGYKNKLASFFGEVQVVPRLDENDEPMYDEEGDEMYDSVTNDYYARDIIRYEIKEDWFFDKQRSVMDVRIIGISPVVYYTNPETGDVMGTKPILVVLSTMSLCISKFLCVQQSK